MRAEIITIGTELLVGQIIDTNSAHIAQKLTPLGIELTHVTSVGDSRSEMLETLNLALNRSQIIILTGGLGPTEDDLTREVVARACRRKLVFHQHLMDQIEAHFRRRGIEMVASNRRQAFIPEGAIPIENPMGTAPGFILEKEGRAVITLPGVPREMEFLLEKVVIPYLTGKLHIKEGTVQSKVLRVCGLGESAVNDRISDIIHEGENPSIGTLASPGDIRIRIIARGRHPSEVKSLMEGVEVRIRERLGDLIYGVNSETLEGIVTKLLERTKRTLVTAETYTGGLIAQRLSGTESPQFLQGVVFNSDEAMRMFLGFKATVYKELKRNGAEFVLTLAEKIRQFYQSDVGLFISGFSEGGGPNGGVQIKARLHVGIASDGMKRVVDHLLGGSKGMVRERAAIFALDFLRRELWKMEKA